MLHPKVRRAGAALGVAPLLVSLACGYAHIDRDIDTHPVVMTGAGATILYPGQGAPTLPMPGAPGSAAPGSPQPPGGSGGAQASSAPPSGAAAPAASAAQRSSAGPTPPGAGNVVFIGGADEDIEKHQRIRREPIWLKPLLLPFAIAAYPFKKAAELIQGKPAANGPAVPDPTTSAPAAPRTREEWQAAQEQASLQSMERELARRQAGAAPTAPAPGLAHGVPATPSVPAAPGASIAQELAVLRATRAGTREGMPTIAPTPEHEASPAPPTPSPAPATPHGVADRVKDRNDDGRPDHWIYRDAGRLVREVFDDDGDGQPDRVLHHDPASGLLAATEEDANHDGRMDTWAQYEAGKIARRRADANGDGIVDVWTFYDAEKIARHEQDTNADGFRDRIGFYESGRLVREEEDRSGDGRPDVITLYDASERMAQRDEDADGDGSIDVRSFYAAGKLTRREILNESALPAGEAGMASGPGSAAVPAPAPTR